MELCKNCEIVHDRSECPLCEAYGDIERLKEQIVALNAEIKKLEENE